MVQRHGRQLTIRRLRTRRDEGVALLITERDLTTTRCMPGPASASPPVRVRCWDLAMQGCTNAQIGAQLRITTNTVEAHMTNALAKLGVDNRPAAANLIHQAMGPHPVPALRAGPSGVTQRHGRWAPAGRVATCMKLTGMTEGVNGSLAGPLPVRDMVVVARRTMVGRRRDIEVVAAALAAGRSVLLEGPPGTGKTTLLRALAAGAGVTLHLVEGNAELSPARLVGNHDPSRILSEGYRTDNFVPGPLVDAMTSGGLLYVEELNRVPEETLNVLLGVLSERRMQVPRVGEVVADPRFRMVAAMNPFDAVGTGRISPAIYDRSCRVAVGYQDEAEERAIVAASAEGSEALVARAVSAVRRTRHHPDLRMGSSVRGAIDIVAVSAALAELRNDADPSGTGSVGLDAALTSLSGRVTLREGSTRTVEEILAEIWAVTAPGDDPGADEGKARGPGAGAART